MNPRAARSLLICLLRDLESVNRDNLTDFHALLSGRKGCRVAIAAYSAFARSPTRAQCGNSQKYVSDIVRKYLPLICQMIIA